jgi:hypothetical protein
MPLPPSILDSVPPGDLASAALDLAQTTLHPTILNHSLRVYFLAKWLAQRESSGLADAANLPLLFAASLCHDLGTTDRFNGSQRFEVEGADAASDLCKQHAVSDADAHRVWVAIALHTSTGIAERIDAFTRLVRVAVKMDFSEAAQTRFGANAYAAEIEAVLPRGEIEKELGDAVVRQAGKIDFTVDAKTWPDLEKFPKASWPGILLRGHLENPGHDGVNLAF